MAVTLRVKYFNTIILRQEPYLATSVTTDCSTSASAPAESNTINVTSSTLSALSSNVSYAISGPGVKDNTTGQLNGGKTVLTFDDNVDCKIEKGVTLTFSSTMPYANNTFPKNEWHVEESRIKGGFNENAIDYGPKAFIVDKKYNRKHRENSMIYSGIFNSRTGINNTNQFSIAENITKSVDLAYGSIQKLYAEDTNLLIFQENKVNGALIDKDAIFTAEGGGLSTTAKVVIGQITPYLGEFGIGKNPESFAVFGFRKYFVDKDRGSVLRLSRDGITEISSYGMRNFFRNHLDQCNSIRGYYDIHSRNYVLNLKLNKFVKQNKQTFLDTIQASILNSVTDSKKIVLSKSSNIVQPGYFIQTGKIKNFSNRVTEVNGNTVTLTNNISVTAGDNVSFMPSSTFGVVPVEPLIDYKTLTFSDKVNGWCSFLTYNPSFGGSLNNSLYTFDKGDLYKHHEPSQDRNTFYGSFSLAL
jgi:hypothetical protein